MLDVNIITTLVVSGRRRRRRRLPIVGPVCLLGRTHTQCSTKHTHTHARAGAKKKIYNKIKPTLAQPRDVQCGAQCARITWNATKTTLSRGRNEHYVLTNNIAIFNFGSLAAHRARGTPQDGEETRKYCSVFNNVQMTKLKNRYCAKIRDVCIMIFYNYTNKCVLYYTLKVWNDNFQDGAAVEVNGICCFTKLPTDWIRNSIKGFSIHTNTVTAVLL